MSFINRQKHYLDFTLSSLLRRKGKNGAVLLVYTLVVFVIASAIFFGAAVRDEALHVLAPAPEVVVQRTVGGRHELIPVAYADRISTIRGVAQVQPRLWGYYFYPAARANYTLMAVPGLETGDDGAVVGSGVLRTWQATGERQMSFRTHDGNLLTLEVVSRLEPATDLVSADLILVSAETCRKILGIPADQATDLGVSVRNPAECATVAAKIVGALPDTRPITRAEMRRTYAALFDWRSGYLVVILSTAALSFFIFAWDKATGLSAEERREVGILKALGWDTADVLALRFWEGAAVSVTAFLCGLAAAYVHVFLGSAPLFAPVLKGWATLFPDLTLHPRIDAVQVATLFFLTVVPYSLITVIPTWRVASADPDAAMRA
jgi:hypothetical protein